MSSLVTKPAPDFKATAVMPDGSFKEISLSDYREKKYVVLFFYPLDFTFVCPTEIVAFSEHVDEFAERNVQILGCSIDSQFTHLAWRNTPRKQGGLGEIRYPLLSDMKKELATSYGVLTEGGVALRGLFLIDKNGIVRHELVNDLPLGRNVGEALRIVEALQFSEQSGEVCPANWESGKTGMKADPKGSQDYFEKTYS
jgi:peroxiredoxin (alkyl hydroperoxide reductase subunit C)